MRRKEPGDGVAALLEPMTQQDCTAVMRGLAFVMGR
tara:strand:- start:348 stop:455 length:108 start_codon:yes stop_codon:yes gene_type:complete